MIASGNDDGVFQIDSSTGEISVLDNTQLNYELTASYVLGVSVEDGINTSAPQTIAINVVDENDIPMLLTNTGADVVEGSSVAIDATVLKVTDEDASPSQLQFSVIDSPAVGWLELTSDPGVPVNGFSQADIDGDRLIYVHDGSEADDSFTFTVSDGSGGSIGSTLFSITNLRVNDAPVNSVPTPQTIDEDAPLMFSLANGNAASVSDVDLNGGVVGVRLTATHGTLTLGSISGLTFANGTGAGDIDVVFAGAITDINAALDGLRFDPAPNYNGLDEIRVVSRDMGNTGSGGEQIDDDTISITVEPVNESPVAFDDEFSTGEDNVLNVAATNGLLANDSDIDGDDLTVIAVTGTSNGTLLLNANGSFDYTPNANFHGTDSFSYRATDGSLQSETRTVTLSVSPVNDAPVSNDDRYVTNQLSTLALNATDGVLINDLDVEADALRAIMVSGPTKGQLVLNADGSLIYTPIGSFFGEDSFTYRANDGSLNGNIATVRIVVQQTVTTGPTGTTSDPVVDKTETTNADPVSQITSKTVVSNGVAPTHYVSPANSLAGNSINAPGEMSTAANDTPANTDDESGEDSSREPATLENTFRIDDRSELRDRISSRVIDDGVIVFTSTDVGSMVYVLEQTGFWTQLDSFQQDVQSSIIQEGDWEELVVETTTVAGTTLTVGYIVWLLRSGSVVFGLVSSLPAWTMVDPLPVLETGLSNLTGGDDSDDDSLQGILQAHQDGLALTDQSFEN